MVDECLEPLEPACAGQCGDGSGVDVFESPQPALDLAAGGYLVADLGGELHDLVPDVVQQRGAGCDQGSAVFEHGLDLGHQQVIDPPESGPAPVSVRPALRERRRWHRRRGSCPEALIGAGSRAGCRDFAGIETRCDQRYRNVSAPFR